MVERGTEFPNYEVNKIGLVLLISQQLNSKRRGNTSGAFIMLPPVLNYPEVQQNCYFVVLRKSSLDLKRFL